jgi:predicted dienelactone hydrolase
MSINTVRIAICFLGFALASPNISVRAADSPYAVAGPHKVIVVATVMLQDPSRGKTIEALVRHPDGAGPFPVIVFSHGSLSNKETFGPASEHWASYGYVVIHPNHADSRSRTTGGANDIVEGDQAKSESQKNRRGAGLGIGGFGGKRANTGRTERIKDVTSVLNSLDQIEVQVPALKGKLDRDAIAVAGHSFGAYVAQCHGGVRTLVDGKLENLSDPRVKCVVPISAQGESESYGLTAESWANARTPAFHITGTRDMSAPDRPGGKMGDVRTKVIPFDRSPAGGKYLLVIEGATHISFGGRLSNLGGGSDAPILTKTMSLAFLEAYLKQDEKAKAWLDGQASIRWLGAKAKMQRKP